MFQGWATNLKDQNDYTKSKFLDRLKTLGSVYTYQNKTNNIYYYEKSNPEHIDFDSDIDFNLSYIKPNTHIKMIYDDILVTVNLSFFIRYRYREALFQAFLETLK